MAKYFNLSEIKKYSEEEIFELLKQHSELVVVINNRNDHLSISNSIGN